MFSKNYLTIKSELDSLQEQKEKVLLEAGNKVASAMMSMNESGDLSVKKIQTDLGELISPFNEEEKVQILHRAAAKLIVNL